MLNLDSKITLDAAAISSQNLCDRFDDTDLTRIGGWVWDGYSKDKQSRSRWEKRTEAAMDLAMQIQKEKTWPWPNCSNVAFPLVTIAVMQFHARAYPALVQGTDIIKYRVVGEDPQGKEKRRADRIGMHMSWQVMEQDQGWEENHDRLAINVSVVGTAFKKSYFNRYNTSELVMAKDLVLDYYAKSVESCPRKTHVIPMFRNEVYERVKRGTFKDILEEPWYKQPPPAPSTTQRAQSDNRQGTSPPQGDETTPFTMLEQHCSLDLDGDGYAEPYIITIEESFKKVVRIVTRFERPDEIERASDGTIISIRALEYFTKYPFIPSPDGGIYDVGFGILLGPLNESVNSLVNQLIDAGSMNVAAGGFLGRGAKIRGGIYSFAPFDWKRLDATGDDIKKSIFPLPVREPSAVLFQLLSMLVNYTNRISGSTDMMVGENPGQNTPAYNAQEMIQQGMKIYSAIFKRIWRSMKEEFRKLYILNGLYMPDTLTFGAAGQTISRQDYLGDPSRVVPVADPNITSDGAQQQQAITVKQSAMTTQGYNLDEVERRFLKAFKVDGIEVLYPGPGKVPPLPNPKLMVEQAKGQVKMAELKVRQMEFYLTLKEEHALNEGKIELMKAQVAEIIASIGAEQAKQQLEVFGHLMDAMKGRQEFLNKQMDSVKQQMELGHSDEEHQQSMRHDEEKHKQSLEQSEEMAAAKLKGNGSGEARA